MREMGEVFSPLFHRGSVGTAHVKGGGGGRDGSGGRKDEMLYGVPLLLFFLGRLSKPKLDRYRKEEEEEEEEGRGRGGRGNSIVDNARGLTQTRKEMGQKDKKKQCHHCCVGLKKIGLFFFG